MLYSLALSATSRFPSTVHDGPRIDYGFIEDLREFIALRLDKVDPYKESKEYRLQQEKVSRLHDKLQEMLPEEGRRCSWNTARLLAPRTIWKWRCLPKGRFWMG